MCHIQLSESETLFCAHRQHTNYFFLCLLIFQTPHTLPKIEQDRK